MKENKISNKFNHPPKIDRFVDRLIEAKNEFSLICFVGAGVSISQGYPNWDQYVDQLIDYWRYHLDTLTEIKETSREKVDMKDTLFLESLHDMPVSNKRKVDFVNFLLKDYCETGNEKKTLEIYNEHVLDFERKIFYKIEPTISKNTILDELVKMEPIFITTNYDDQIEKSYLRSLAKNPIIVRNLDEISGPVEPNSVIHIHGVPDIDCNPDLFVSSAKSYSDTYFLGRNQEKIAKLLEGKNSPVFLFIGCSMEEDEILSLLKKLDENRKLKSYAIMRLDGSHQIKDVNDRKKEIIEKYYNAEHNVEILWFGTEFSDLPIFVNEITSKFDGLKKSSLANPERLRKELTIND